METKMKGIIKLIPIEKPIEGMKVVTCSAHLQANASIGELVNNPAGHMWNVKLPSNRVLPFGISELSQIAIEYEEKDEKNGGWGYPLPKTLPLLSTDWEYAIKHIGEEVEFTLNEYEYGQRVKPYAILNIPSPIMYTEEEVRKLVQWAVGRFKGSELQDYVSESDVDKWFDKNKKK